MPDPTEPVDDSIDREIMELLMFGTGRVRRFTQDSPVLPDVWLEYAKGGVTPVRLLFTPTRETPSGSVRTALAARLNTEHPGGEWKRYARLVYHQTTVAATLYFEDLIRVVLPMTAWWGQRELRKWPLHDFDHTLVAKALLDPEHASAEERDDTEQPLPADLLWLVRVVGALAYVRRYGALPKPLDSRATAMKAAPDDWKMLWRALVDAVADMVRNIIPYDGAATIWSVSLNREATPTVAKSMLAIKADAGRRLFEISCADLRWGIIDSGVDARHPAFRKRQRKDGKDVLIDDKFATRVLATYDFTYLDVLLDPDNDAKPERVQARLDKVSQQEKDNLEETLTELKRSLAKGRTIDWKLVEPLLRVPHVDGQYADPPHDHGTHVAGILAGNWTKDDNNKLPENIVGVCPDINLYDLRVLDNKGRGNEFSVMAALQFVRYLNSTNDFVAVHGVNLSTASRKSVSVRMKRA